MKVLVTGADGFLGSNLVRELIARKHTVVAALQPGRHVGTLDGLPLERKIVDLRYRRETVAAFEGIDAAIHAAADTSTWPSRSPRRDAFNIVSTQNMIDGALEAGVRRLVHIGTANSFPPGSAEHPRREEGLFEGPDYGLGYIDSKRRAHRRVLAAVSEKGLPAVVLCPTFMMGPFDSRPGPGRMILQVAKKGIPPLPPGGRNIVDVRNVAVAGANALEKGEVGESYILAGENMHYGPLFQTIAEVVGRPGFGHRVPKAGILAFGALNSGIGAFFRRPPGISFTMAKIACDENFYDATTAKTVLGLPKTDVRQAVADSFAWLQRNGYLEE
ncbi:MAG: NAD-dependent epimerase/dehydratase family protein [Spirochaetaceae bacterium]